MTSSQRNPRVTPAASSPEPTGGDVHAPSGIVISGIEGHERPVPSYDIPPPTETVGPRMISTLAFAQLALFIALLGPVSVSMALKVQDIVGKDQAASSTGLILGIGAIAALIGNPVFGHLSDRTTGRWGRRRPWMVGGAIGLALFLFVIAIGNSVALLMIAWFCAQLCANAAFAAYLATIADQIPPRQSATITALSGVMQNVGILVAIWLAGALTSNMIALFLVPAAIGVIGMLIYAIVLPDAVLRKKPPSVGLAATLKAFWVSPRLHPDFAWAFVSRFLLILGSFLFSTFRIFWMEDELGLSEDDAVSAVLKGVIIYTVVLVIVGQFTGWLSDRLGRRKILVFASTALYAVGLIGLTQVHSLSHFYIIEATLGAAYGIYMGVDLALVMAVLPNPDDSAKDLGVFNIANAMPQSLAPFIGAGLLAIGASANNYTLLYISAAIFTFLGALAIIPVKSVR